MEARAPKVRSSVSARQPQYPECTPEVTDKNNVDNQLFLIEDWEESRADRMSEPADRH